MTDREKMMMASPACREVIEAEHPSPEDGGPCATCAFRKGTEANGTPHTLLLVAMCVEGFRPFHCHEKPQLCRGYIASANVRGVPTPDEQVGCDVIGKACDALSTAIDNAARK